MFTVYVLYSISFKKPYIGYTSDLDARFISHNELGTKGYTLKYRPWVIAHTEQFDTKAEAMKREKELKSSKGRAFIWNIIRQKFGNSDDQSVRSIPVSRWTAVRSCSPLLEDEHVTEFTTGFFVANGFVDSA